ncbi:hypothetical protein EDD36DRAFT_137414 [Exophiala viscosa]|uniref:Uncharacterized protein n=1 Tax=Exophiala viscosa TaxID=2486360 RepID=A0AAN6E2B6_9EURO|nr:hypothetical protein EDD36DRAFT_137414 [Exophiala viscosa]
MANNVNSTFNLDEVEIPNEVFTDLTLGEDDTESCTTSSSFSAATNPDEVLLEDLESELNTLTLDAQTIISHQPRATQLQLTSETRTLFNSYQQHGSMARLKIRIEKFLRRGDNDGKLRFEDLDVELASSYPGHYGEAFMINYTADDDVAKFDDRKTRITNTLNGRSSSNHPLRIVDPESISYVTTLPWDPVGMVVSWPGSLEWPYGLLSRINQILSLVDVESRARLFHHVSKYGPSPVFRVGIAEHVQSQYATMFQSEEDHFLWMTPETRSFLRSVFDAKPLISHAERRMIARICRVAEESVSIFWEDTTDELRGFRAMKTFMTAREVERAKAARTKHARSRNAKEGKKVNGGGNEGQP